MKSDPIYKCKVCGNLLPPVAIKHSDPYCTSGCARIDYGNPLPGISIWQRDNHEPRKAASS